jgi:hypothetical protein
MKENEALKLALEALEKIALAGMSGTGQESDDAMTEWHARQAWKFIGIAARALTPIKEALKQEQRCEYCDGTGDVHDFAGEWRGVCVCEAGKALKQEQDEPVAVVGEVTHNGYLYKEIIWKTQTHTLPLGTCFYTRPQQLKPLNGKQINQLIKKAGYGDEQNEAISNFVNGIAFAEDAHGINDDANLQGTKASM